MFLLIKVINSTIFLDTLGKILWKIQSTNPNIITAGIVKIPPRMKNAPGIVLMVAAYVALYIGPYKRGISASHAPNNEFSFPKIK